MSFFDKLNYNSRERLTATDLNRLHTLLGADVLNVLMYFLNDKNAASFLTGIYNGVIGGLKVTSSGAATVAVEPGMVLQYDATDTITPLGETSKYRLGRLDADDTLSYSVGPVPAVGHFRADTIQVRHRLIPIEYQNRDVWSGILSLFTPQNVYKRYRPGLSVQVLTGTDMSAVPPAATAGWIKIATTYIDAFSLTVYDERQFLLPKMFGHPYDAAASTDGSIYNRVELRDSSGGKLPGTLVGLLDTFAATAKGLQFYLVGSGYHVLNLGGAVLATLSKDSTTSAILRFRDNLAATWLEIKDKIVATTNAQWQIKNLAGDIKILISDTAEAIQLGGITTTDKTARLDGDTNTLEFKSVDDSEGLQFKSLSGLLAGGWMTTTNEGDSGYVATFTANEAIGAGEVVEIDPVIGQVQVARAVANSNETWASTNPVVIGNVKTHGVCIESAAINTPVKICLYGICFALTDSNVLLSGNSLIGSTAVNGILSSGTGAAQFFGTCGRLLRNGPGGGPTYLAKIHFYGSDRNLI